MKLNILPYIKYITISVIIFFLLMAYPCIYTINHPKNGIVINKHYYNEGNLELSCGNSKISGYVYPNYKITLLNANRVTTICVSENEYNNVKKWRIYTAKHNLNMYY